MDRKEKVLSAAKRARLKLEKYTNNLENKIPDKDMAGLCVPATWLLYRTMRSYRLRPTIWINNLHCFLVHCGNIVDISATQFGLRRIVIEPVSDMNFDFYKLRREFKSDFRFLAYQYRYWPKGQRIEDHPKLMNV